MQAYGIDKSSSQIAKAKERHDKQRQRLHFHQIEAWDLNSMLRLATADDVQFNVVFIDVSGSRRVGDVDNLIMKYEQVCCDPPSPVPVFKSSATLEGECRICCLEECCHKVKGTWHDCNASCLQWDSTSSTLGS